MSWASQDVAPGSGHGTIILVGHINYGGVAGAFADLADYRVGQKITLVLADGRRMNYAVAAPPIAVNKNALGPRREELFDQSYSYGLAGHPKVGPLLLSRGGASSKPPPPHKRKNFSFPPSCKTSPSAGGSTSLAYISASGHERGRSRFLGNGL